MIFERQNEPIDEAKISGFEATRTLRLPADYRAFLLKYNGGRPADSNAFFKVQGLILLSIEEICGITVNPLNSIEGDAYNNFSNSVHAQLLQIAYTGSQDLYMDLREGPTHGRIYILARPANDSLKVDDTGFHDEDDYEEALFLHPVAKTFSQFLALLGPAPEEEDVSAGYCRGERISPTRHMTKKSRHHITDL